MSLRYLLLNGHYLQDVRRAFDLIAPAVPTQRGAAGKQLQVWAVYQALDAPINLARLTAVLSAGRDDELENILCLAVGMPPSRQQAKLRVAPRPVPQAHKEAKATLVELAIDEGYGLIGEAPSLDDLECSG